MFEDTGCKAKGLSWGQLAMRSIRGGIVAAGAGSVDALRYGPNMQQIFGRRTEEFDAGGTVEPRFETIAGKKYRHTVVNATGEFIGFRDDHCAREQGLAAGDVLPFIP